MDEDTVIRYIRTLNPQDIRYGHAQGGRIGYQAGTFPAEKLYWDLFLKYFHVDKMDPDAAADKAIKEFRKYNAQGGRIGYQVELQKFQNNF